MTTYELRALAKEHLIPLISGATIDDEVEWTLKRGKKVASIDPCTIAFKLTRNGSARLRLRRPQPFEAQNSGNITEIKLVQAFVNVIQTIEPALSQSYRDDLLTSLGRRVVSNAVASPEFRPVLLQTLDQFAKWSSKLYEGQPISSSVGFILNDNTKSVALADVWKHDFSAVLANGHDTLLTASKNGHVIAHESLQIPSQLPSFAPHRLSALADWADSGKLVVALNRNGEILILKNKRLVFAWRSGTWHFLTPGAVVTQLARPNDQRIRTAIIETALDVSFARTGGCIGVVSSPHASEWKGVVVHHDDRLRPAKSVKARSLERALRGRLFHELDRRLRQEIVAIDGATVVDHRGKILAVGAILKIPGGSEGGGRLAAARALSALGLGLKISQDGGIRCYHDRNETPSFSLM